MVTIHLGNRLCRHLESDPISPPERNSIAHNWPPSLRSSSFVGGCHSVAGCRQIGQNRQLRRFHGNQIGSDSISLETRGQFKFIQNDSFKYLTKRFRRRRNPFSQFVQSSLSAAAATKNNLAAMHFSDGRAPLPGRSTGPIH